MLQVLWKIPILGGIPIYGFGMMLFLAFLLCTWVASWRARRERISPRVFQDLAVWIFVGGIVGARQPHDGIVYPGKLCGIDHLLRIGSAQAPDDVAYGLAEQLDFLRQISQVLTVPGIA